MKKQLFQELLQSVKEAVAIERGDAKASRKFEVKRTSPKARKIATRTKPHPLLKKIKMSYNPVEPMSNDEWPKNAR